MKAGSLDRRVTLQAKTSGRDDFGADTESWAPLATVWAQKLDVTGRERLAGGQVQAEMDARFRVRWRGDVSAAATRLVYAGRTYDILAIAELGRREGLELSCRVRVD
jgi:SPP1 family predicted phage head-tail adaptor